MRRQTYHVEVEVVPRAGSQMAQEGAGVGAIVSVFVPARSEKEAERLCRAALEEDAYDVSEVVSVAPFADIDWDPEMPAGYDELAAQALGQDEVVYGCFYTWHHDDDDENE